MNCNKKLKNLALISLIPLMSSSIFSASASPADPKLQSIKPIVSSEKIAGGKLFAYPKFESKYVNPRRVQVWLPSDYSSKQTYAVIYMHDGQMLFDKTAGWNGQEWGVDELATKLSKRQDIRPFIVVGIDNGGNEWRHSEYFPQKPFESLSKEFKQNIYKAGRSTGHSVFNHKVNSDKYLKFLVTELKPFIDAQYSVNSTKENTFLVGSSMGGLISMYSMLEYPDVFGGAACLSTHWPGIFSMENNPIPDAFYKYLDSNLNKVTDHKLYFDYGDQTLDAMYPPLQKQVDKIMAKRNVAATLWQTQFFKGEEHSENSWMKRLDIPFEFLLKK